MNAQPEADMPDGATEELYCVIVTPGDSKTDEQLAAAMEEVYKASARDPNRWRNNPEKKRKALEGLDRVLGEWQEENGPFTEEERPAPALSSPVSTFVLDAGALIAVDRGNREVLSMLQSA